MRSSWKTPFFNPRVTARLEKAAPLGRDFTLLMSHRRQLVDSDMTSRFFAIPNGRGLVKLGIKPRMVGHRLGEFVRTRVHCRHNRKKRRKELEKRRKEASKKLAAAAKGGAAKGTAAKGGSSRGGSAKNGSPKGGRRKLAPPAPLRRPGPPPAAAGRRRRSTPTPPPHHRP